MIQFSSLFTLSLTDYKTREFPCAHILPAVGVALEVVVLAVLVAVVVVIVELSSMVEESVDASLR